MSEQPMTNESTLKSVVCMSCDGFCPVAAKVKDGQVVKVTTREHPFFHDVICMKGAYAPKSFAHPERIHHPLKRIGARGDGAWQQVTWDQAMDDIAERLRGTVAQYGPESLAVAASYANIGLDNGLTRRFMNLVGTPNFISGVAYCMGNTAAVNRMVYGWYPRGDIINSKCIVLFGHDPRRHSWTLEYKSIRVAQAAGASLIVLDPRKSGNAQAADIWLPLRAGTDAAMTMGWLKVIIDEGLYDADFVRNWTVGFDQFVERVNEYPLDRVASITGVDAELIAKAARLYANSKPAVIPWSPITDQQVSSTSAIRLQCALRALTGNIDVKGGEMMVGFNPGMRSDTEVELHGALAGEQKAKQLGADEFPVFTYRGMEALGPATEKVWGSEWANLVSGCYMANPMAVFRAMEEEQPYPVKAFFALANNTLMSFANTQRIYNALMNQDLIVAYEHMLTPTAQLADYVLPGDSWLERPSIMAGISEQAMAPPGECRSIVYFWRELAKRMGLAGYFPWHTAEEVFDFRLEPSGLTWEQVLETGRLPKAPYQEKKYLETGFATPSGKVELYSSVLDDLGFDPLPYYRESATPNDDYPMAMFIGLPDDEYYRTGHRHIPELRRRAKDPTLFVHEADARALELGEGDWATVVTSTGKMVGRVFVRSSMPKGLVRVPHGWWKPESRPGLENMSGMWSFADAQITADEDPDLIDREQGIPHMKGVPCRLTKLSREEVTLLEAEFGGTGDLPKGPQGKTRLPAGATKDFMYDEDFGDGVEFQAIELSLYGRSSL
ncbi:MAG: molybdopterin-dependent oxidoreductase [Gammaproteobacteria bacterium]|nr:molybdopterin-dependent oxidoreductase [Gammaproteobacteria bacterium]